MNHSTKLPHPAKPRTAGVIGLILATEALWIARTFDSTVWIAPAATIIAMVVWYRLRRDHADQERAAPTSLVKDRPRTRWVHPGLACIAGGVVAGLLMIAERTAYHSGTGINVLLMAADVLAHLAWLVSGILMIVWPRTGHPWMIPAGSLLVLVTVAAGGASQTLNGQTTAALAFCIVFVLASQFIHVARFHWVESNGRVIKEGFRRNAGMRGDHSAARAIEQREPTSVGHLKMLLSLLVLSLMLIVTSAIANATHDVLPDIQMRLHRSLRDSLEAIRVEPRLLGNHYVRGTQFGSVRRHMLSDPQRVALRVHADAEPGYLRGTVLDVFERRRWQSLDALGWDRLREFGFITMEPATPSAPTGGVFAEQRQEAENDLATAVIPERLNDTSHLHRRVESSTLATTPLRGSSSRPLQRFQFPATENERVATIEVHNDPAKGPVIFTALSTAWVEAVGRQLTLSQHDVVLGGIDLNEPYVVGVPERTSASALSDSVRAALLSVPPAVVPAADEVLARLGNGPADARTKAARVSDYFQSRFSYSLASVEWPRDEDPIAYFLRTEHPAHCEYFATASAMLLRRAGVPTRYVTGYVVDEYRGEKDDWLARNADAHAWVEAYDDASGTWFPVESTPGRIYSTITLPSRTATNRTNVAGSEDGASDEEATLLGRLARWWALLRSNDPVMVVLRMLQVPLLVVVAGLLWYRQRAMASEFGNVTDVQSRKLLARVDRRLRRQGLVRPPHETLHQFADRVERATLSEPEAAPRLAQWYRDYADARYQNQVPPNFA